MDAAFWESLGQRGPWLAVIGALITLVVFMVRLVVGAVSSGKWVPRSTYDDLRQDRDTWRKACETLEQSRTITARQAEELLTTAQLTNQLLTSLKAAGDKT